MGERGARVIEFFQIIQIYKKNLGRGGGGGGAGWAAGRGARVSDFFSKESKSKTRIFFCLGRLEEVIFFYKESKSKKNLFFIWGGGGGGGGENGSLE